MLHTKYFTVLIFHSCFFYVNPWDSNLANCPVFPRYFRKSISDSHGTGDDLRASGIDREYDRTTDTCQISDSSRGYRTRTSQDWSRTIKNFVTMHAASSLSLPPFLPLSLFLTKIRPRMFHRGKTCRFSCVEHTWCSACTRVRMRMDVDGEAAAVPIFFVAAQGHALPSRATQ